MKDSLQALQGRLRDRLRAGKHLAGPLRDLLRRCPLHRCTFFGLRSPRPQGLHWLAKEYLAHREEARNDLLHPVYPAESGERSLPLAPGGELPEIFARLRDVRVPEAGVFEMRGVRFWGGCSGCVIGGDNRLLADLSPDIWGPERHRALTVPWLPKVRELPGLTAILAAHGEFNYWHWMTEALPRLHLLEKAGFPPARVDRYLTTATGTRFQRETLAALGIPAEKLFRVDARAHLRLETALVPCHRPASWDVPGWAVRFLRDLPWPAVSTADGGARLYAMRGAEEHRRLACESDLLPLLRDRGFTVIRSAQYSVAEQRALFARASVIVAPHGAALTNLVFCQPDTLVLDLMSAAWPGLFFWGLSKACDLRYACLLDGGAEPFTAIPDLRRDIQLSAAEIVTRLDGLLAKQFS